MGNIQKQEIILIVAYLANSRGIGFQGKLPWENTPIKSDMSRFKKETLNSTVIMGKDTWLSLPKKYRPLPERQNIVVSNTLDPHTLPKGVELVHSVDEALSKAVHEKIFPIGGVKMFEEFMTRNLAHKILATIVYSDLLKYDRVFPEIEKSWKNVYQSSPTIDPSSKLKIQFCSFLNSENFHPSYYSGGYTDEGTE